MATLAIEYQDLQENVNLPKDNPYIVLQSIVKGCSEKYADVALVLARILVCKPHSADCERLISLSNKVKSTSRASCQRQTVSDYLYINMNMPPLCEFAPRPAVWQWLEDKDRRERDTPKAAKQEWFMKVFHQDIDNDTQVDVAKIKREF